MTIIVICDALQFFTMLLMFLLWSTFSIGDNEKSNRIQIERIDACPNPQADMIIRSHISRYFKNIGLTLYYSGNNTYLEYEFDNLKYDRTKLKIVDTVLYTSKKIKVLDPKQKEITNSIRKILKKLPDCKYMRNSVWGDKNTYIIENYREKHKKVVKIWSSDNFQMNLILENLIIDLLKRIDNPECHKLINIFINSRKLI